MEHLKCRPIGQALALSSNIRLGWKALPGINTQAYYEKSVTYARKKVYNIGPRIQCYKTFYGRYLRMFIISQSVCPWQAFPAKSSVQGETLQLITETVNYGHNKFNDTCPRSQCLKTFYCRNLRIFVISQSVCPWQASPAQSIVCGKGQEPTKEWNA